MNDYTFGNFLYSLRTEKGFSQSQLGEMLGVTNKAVSKWENGSSKPNTILIPRLAEILGVSVEELFACKRFEKDSEHEKIKAYLSSQKRKYAILSSIFLSAIITLPLLLIEFICVVVGFALPDEVAGPLGAVTFILAFIVSATAFVIYQKNFKQNITPSELEYSSIFICKIKNGILASCIALICVFILLLISALILFHFTNLIVTKIVFSIGAFILIILLGVLIYFINIKRLLKIEFSKKAIHIRFLGLSIWAKICYITLIVFSILIIILKILRFFSIPCIILEMLSYIVCIGCIVALKIYSIKSNK